MKGLLLLSGGFDSPIAGCLMKERGMEIIALNFSYELLTDNQSTLKSKEIAEKLGFEFLTADISEELMEISKKCKRDLYFVLMKRLFLKIAGKVSRGKGCDFIITGDNLAQVSSQTLQNLVVVTQATEIPILRPLIGFDKQEIIDIANQIGTYEISKGKEHCDILGPEHPETKARLEEVLHEEEKLEDLSSGILDKLKEKI